jgi:glycosyltransferase involved in cell wall biosynthesis
MLLTVLFYVFIAVIFIEILFFSIAAISFKNMSKQTKLSDSAVSLILYTKNQADVLKKQLPIFLKQDHKNFEIVIINHASTDETLEVMEKFQKKYPDLKIIDIKNNETFWASKKYALTLGIKAATHEQLVLSTINFEPQSTSWLQHIAAIAKTKSMVIGYVKYANYNYFYRFFDFLRVIKNYTLGKIGFYYSGTSANVSYSKQLFFSSNGFIQHMGIPFGETTLFVNEVAKKSNTAFCLHKDCFVVPVKKPRFERWLQEQIKNDLKLKHCKPSAQIANAVLFFCHCSFYLLAPFLLFFCLPEQQIFVISLIVGRFMIQYISYTFIAKKLQDLKLIVALPLFEILKLIMQFLIFISRLNSNRVYWN